MSDGDDRARRLLDRLAVAKARRAVWEPLWRECYAYVLPQNALFSPGANPGERRGDTLFDGTAADAVDQLAASLLAQLTPPWSRWAALEPGPDLTATERDGLSPVLERISRVMADQFDRSNLAVEIHQCFLDAITVGTGCLLVEEAPPGGPSALRFAAVPLSELVLEEGADGRLDTVWRQTALPAHRLVDKFGAERLPIDLVRRAADAPDTAIDMVEMVTGENGSWRWTVMLPDPGMIVTEGRFADCPFIAFRWLKAPGEVYGRGPVMKALPDIKTANKVVELVLRNASIAVTGMWQADDDGVLNPAAIRLVPGTIIPKAIGSAGLTPLASPGRFDVSQLVLEDLRARIRHALLADRLGALTGPRMTATEVLERSAEMARLLGATFGRLQSELLLPLLRRSLSLLRRRGEIPDIIADGRLVRLRLLSPLARAQAQQDAGTTIRWLEGVVALGPEALSVVDLPACARFLAETAGVPSHLLRPESALPGSAAGTGSGTGEQP